MITCDKLPYENPRIDTCIAPLVAKINAGGEYRTIASCCGHGWAIATIVVEERATCKIYEWFTGFPLKKAKKHRYYKKDKKTGWYLINSDLEDFTYDDIINKRVGWDT
jgi:tRNA(Phe) wybutosine-synthesizing methylase Tyw3